jgi:serine/threonine protein kinase
MDLALKIVQAEYLDDSASLATMRSTVRRVRKLNHPNIARIYDEGVENDIFYYTMQYLEGLTLRKIINLRRDKEQPFNLQEVEPIFSQIAEALEYAHTTTYHGYLKPHNIIVLPDLLKLTDFGIVQAIPVNKLLAAQKKQPESLVYLAPEISQGKDADGRADIYSLGIILGEMLTCISDPDEIITIHEVNDEAHPLLDDVYQRAISRNPKYRYQHISDFVADLTSILEYGELAEDEEVPTVIVDAELDMEYTDKGMALDTEDGPEELEVNQVRFDEHPTIPADQHDDSSVQVNDSIMELSAIDAELEEDEEFADAGQITPPPLPAHIARKGGPPQAGPSIQFEGESAKVKLPASGGPPPLPSLGPPDPSIAAGNPHKQQPVPPKRPESGAKPPSPFKTNQPPAAAADTATASSSPQIPASPAPAQAPQVGGPPPFPPQQQVYPTGHMPPTHRIGHAPPPYPPQEDTGFSRAGIFFFVLGMILIFGTGGIGLYFKFVYLPKYNKTNQTNPGQNVTPTPGRTIVDAGPRTQPPPIPQVRRKRPRPTPVRPAPRPETRRDKPKPRPVERRKTRPKPPRRRPVKRRKLVARAKPKKKEKPCPKGMKFIRKGGFLMGSAVGDQMRNWGEKKLVWTRTKPYCIDRFEYPGPGRRPKTGVNFYTAKKLCEKKGKRLCTEQEWERACKGSRNIRFPYGNNFDANRCNTRTKDDQNRSITSSGRFRKCYSPYGVYDMSGNAAEWTSSRYRSSSSSRVIRGGSAKRPDWAVRCASRSARSPSSGKSTLGFRCCADPKTP